MNGSVFPCSRINRLWVKHLRAEVGQVGGLGERATLDRVCAREYCGIRGHQPGHVFPYLNVFDVERWEAPSYGGHFPALETPDVLADSLVRFVSVSR